MIQQSLLNCLDSEQMKFQITTKHTYPVEKNWNRCTKPYSQNQQHISFELCTLFRQKPNQVDTCKYEKQGSKCSFVISRSRINSEAFYFKISISIIMKDQVEFLYIFRYFKLIGNSVIVPAQDSL